jgi:3'-phosphoadenosine 5'-phosphosulfate sulfotransferase (PAPS reductase)/FAD synthetase
VTVVKKDRNVRIDLGLHELAMQPEGVARLTGSQRVARVEALIAEAHYILDQADARLVTGDDRTLAATVLLLSGGNDSTVCGHITRHRCDTAAHANTGVGIEATRQYVRDLCREWRLPLMERKAPNERDSYRAHVLKYGFPGAGMHSRMFQRLKERGLMQVQRELMYDAGGGRKARTIFVAGRRRTESKRRATIPELERSAANPSIVWASPLVNWTKLDFNTYRLMHRDTDPVPVNPVADALHMSGECLCGCFAKEGERESLLAYSPLDMAEILELEALLADRTDIKEHAKTWGWSWNKDADPRRVKAKRSDPEIEALFPVGYLCAACEVAPEDMATVIAPKEVVA